MTPANDNGPLTAEALREALTYDRETGVFVWRIRRGNVAAGSVAGRRASNGYWRIKLCGGDYPAHRLAWLYETGRWPICVLDHIDRDPLNNSIANLREASFAQNQHNRVEQRNNSSGFKGVSFVQKTGKWRADIKRSGVAYYLGQHATAEMAAEAYRSAAAEIHGEFARDSAGRIAAANDNTTSQEAAA